MNYDVLIACEFSGTVRDAFIKAGHRAISCDLLPTEKEGPHLQCSVLDLDLSKYKLMVAHPPCTYLSNAGARHLYPKGVLNDERYQKGLEAKKFFMYLLNAPVERIAIENPVQSKVFEIPKYDQIVHPFFFGHPFKKQTCLWLKNLPELTSTEMIENSESTREAKWYNKGGKDRQKNRSVTFQGVADAMADQWGHLI